MPAIALCAALIGSLTACKVSDDALAASEQMTATASALNDFYKALDGSVADTVALYELDGATLGIPYDEEDRKLQQETRSELQKRREVAGILAELASSLAVLTNSKAASHAETTASELGTELIALKALPKGSPIPDAVGKAGSLLLQMVQQHEEKKAGRALDETLAAVGELFEKEQPVYDSLARNHYKEASQVAQDLINANGIDPSPMLAPALRPFALTPLPPSPALQKSLKALALSRLDRSTEAATRQEQAASKAMLDCLHEMNARVHQLASGQAMPSRATPLSLKVVEDWARSASASSI